MAVTEIETPPMTHSKVRFAAGLEPCTIQTERTTLPLSGTIPAWLRGTLYRNGPALWQAGSTTLQHWFDGFAKLHAFTIEDDGTVSFQCRMLESEQYRRSLAQGRLWRRLFSTQGTRRWYHKISQFIWPRYGDNALVNIQPIAGKMLVMTESPRQVSVNPDNLAALGDFQFTDQLRGDNTTAHPMVDPVTGELINLLTKYSKVTKHQFTRMKAGTQQRELIGVLRANEPSYHHSFGLTPRFIIFTECPFVVQPLRMVFGNSTILGSYRWKPELGLRISLLDRKTGAVLGPFKTDPFFGFHHVNAYDEGDEVVFDLPVVEGPQVFEELLMSRMVVDGIVTVPVLKRFRVNHVSGRVNHCPLGSGGFDFPIIDECQRCKPAQVIYGCGLSAGRSHDMLNQLVRRPCDGGQDLTWVEEGCYPGEPIFVAKPGGAPDDGVLLSVVLDANRSTSFLLILDATSMRELARAQVPHVVPFGFHGSFVPIGNKNGRNSDGQNS